MSAVGARSGVACAARRLLWQSRQLQPLASRFPGLSPPRIWNVTWIGLLVLQMS